jgi:hypothetical protein
VFKSRRGSALSKPGFTERWPGFLLGVYSERVPVATEGGLRRMGVAGPVGTNARSAAEVCIALPIWTVPSARAGANASGPTPNRRSGSLASGVRKGVVHRPTIAFLPHTHPMFNFFYNNAPNLKAKAGGEGTPVPHRTSGQSPVLADRRCHRDSDPGRRDRLRASLPASAAARSAWMRSPRPGPVRASGQP